MNDGLPLLLDYQRRWAHETADVAVCEKSRRIGVSWADAAERVVHAGEGKGNVFYMSYSKDMTETYIDDCADWARKLDQAVGDVLEERVIEDDREILRFRIRCASGKDILALPSNARVLRSKGKPGDIFIIDEAAFCDDLEELLKAAVAVTQWGGKLRIISTHNGDENAFNELVNDIRSGRQAYALHRITLDDAIGCGLVRRICTVKGAPWTDGTDAAWRAEQFGKYRSSDAADEELLCVPRRGGGAYFPRVLVESRMADTPVVRFDGSAAYNMLAEHLRRAEMETWLEEELGPLLADLDPLRRHVIGGDFARSGDLSVYAPLEIGETLRRRAPFLLEMHNVPHEQQVQAVTYICDRLPRFAGGAFDARGNGSYLAEKMVDTYGSIVEAVMLTEGWHREQMPRYKAAFEDDRIAVPRNDDVLSDHRAIRMVRGVPRLPEGQTAKGRHGDSAIALALGWYASEQDGGPVEFESLGPREGVTAMDSYVGHGLGRGVFGGYGHAR